MEAIKNKCLKKKISFLKKKQEEVKYLFRFIYIPYFQLNYIVFIAHIYIF